MFVNYLRCLSLSLLLLGSCKKYELANQTFAAYRYDTHYTDKNTPSTKVVMSFRLDKVAANPPKFEGLSVYTVFVGREKIGEFWLSNWKNKLEDGVIEATLIRKNSDSYFEGEVSGTIQFKIETRNEDKSFIRIVGGKIVEEDFYYSLIRAEYFISAL